MFRRQRADAERRLTELRERQQRLEIDDAETKLRIETAVEAMKEGAYDFITKPIDANHFDIVVRKSLERVGLKRELELFSEDADRRYRLIIGKSEKMKEAVETARKAATSKATVLLLGESGLRARDSQLERKEQPTVRRH